jgi:molecular chaperone DnaK (HSP70)
MVYGIDLGTTYSVISKLGQDGVPEVIENYADGTSTLASAVYFPADGEPVVGKVAKNQAEVEPDRVVQFAKRYIGKENPPIHNFNGVDYDPIMVSSIILKRLKEFAEEQGNNVEDVVITCPAYFGNEERAATRQAGIIAGLNVLNIVNEPTAAALNYCSRQFAESQTILVFDLGGGTFDITLINFSVNEDSKATIEVIASSGDDRLGGVDWDEVMFQYMCEQYATASLTDKDSLDSELRLKIRGQVEEAKKGLSFMTSKNITINYNGDATRVEVSRAEFEKRSKFLVDKTMTFTKTLLETASMDASDIKTVLLVGGSTLMPMIKAAVEELFPKKSRVEQPDLAVAKGASLAAAIEFNESIRKKEIEIRKEILNKTGTDQEESKKELEKLISVKINVPGRIGRVIDKLTRSLGPAVLVEDGSYKIDNLLFVGDSVNSEATSVYGTVVDNQEKVSLTVFENFAIDRVNKHVVPSVDERGRAQHTDPALKVKVIGEVSLNLPPHTPKDTQIQVTFSSSTNGLKVTAINLATLEKAEAVIDSENTKTQAEIDEAMEFIAKMKTKSEL